MLNRNMITRSKFSVLGFFCVFCMITMLFPVVAMSAPERLTESSEYKDKDFRKGCISDYANMVKGDDIDWVWVSPGLKLANYRVSLGKFENYADELRSSQVDEVKSIFKEYLGKLKGQNGALVADMCVYEVQKFSPGKAWIPFAGGHQMQAGVGVELTVKEKGKLIAKFRHFAREGAKIEDAAQEVAEDLKKYFSKN